MDLGLADKTVLITGSSRGIGRATAIAFAKEGARVVLSSRGGGDLDDALAQVSAHGIASSVVGDLTTRAGCEAIVEGAVKAFGGLDILVNNVGGSGARTFDESDAADFQSGLDRNLWPAYHCSRAAVPHLRAKKGGVIAMVTSIYGRESGGAIAYNVAKAADLALAKAMSRDLAPDGIRVFSVAPGSILFEGGGWDRRQKANPEKIAEFVARELPFGRFGRVEEVAEVIAFLCSPRASWVAGACVPIDGAQSRAF